MLIASRCLYWAVNLNNHFAQTKNKTKKLANPALLKVAYNQRKEIW